VTSHKHLKDAVRTRMARTGERYTTAHRHLTAGGPPARPVGLAAGYPAFGGGRHHDSALLAHLLEAAGVTAAHDDEPLDEPVVAGLAGGVGFMYFSFSYAGHLPTMTIVPRIHPRPFLLGALDRSGIPYRVSETASAAKAARELETELAAGRTPLCTVDRAALPYQAWADDQAGATPHDVVVAGRRDDVLLLDDDCLSPTPVTAATMAAARAGHRASKHRMVVVPPGPNRVDLATAVPAALRVTVHDLTEDVMPGGFAGNFGLRGMAKWADAVADRRTKKGWSRLFDSGPALATALRRLHDCLTFDHSSPGAMRPLYADFLDRAGTVLDSPALREAGDRYAAAGAVWAQLAEEASSGFMAPYRELVGRRMGLLLDRGADATEELQDLARSAAAFAGTVDVGDTDRAAVLDRLAALAAEVVPLERDACAALADAAAG
jgi:hypothetical protein